MGSTETVPRRGEDPGPTTRLPQALAHKPPGIAWRPWSKGTFAQARRDGRAILVNVAAGWCHWCHVMDEKTFADPGVQAILRNRFVCIRIDADARPDLAERYVDWGWPATAVLTPAARPVLELRGYQDADAFVTVLLRVVARLEAGTLLGRQEPQDEAPGRPAEGKDGHPTTAPRGADADRQGLQAAQDLVAAQLDAQWDEAAAGWGEYQKYPLASAVLWSLRRGATPGRGKGRNARNDDGAARALRTLEAMRGLVDPEDGGMYQYSVDGRWDRPHFERLAAVQAGAMEAYARGAALARTAAPRQAPHLLAAARCVEGYVLDTLRRQDGLFGASQDADAQGPDGVLPGADYFRRGAAARRAAGRPRLDTNAYADANALLVCGLLAVQGRTGDPATLAAARTCAAALLRRFVRRDGAVRHDLPVARESNRVLHLRDNATAGEAFLAMHEVTGEPQWLDAARRIAAFLLLRLRAPDNAFWGSTADPDAVGVFTQRRRPLEENGRAIGFLHRLAQHEADEGAAAALRDAALAAAVAMATPERVRPEGRMVGEFLVALQALLDPPLKVTVVAGTSSADRVACAALVAAARALPMDVVVVHAQPGGAWPTLGAAAAFLCEGTRCSPPVHAAAELGAAAARFSAA